MKPTSPFSPSLRLWKPWKTATCAHPFFLSGFLPIQRKVSIFYQAVLSSKKAPKHDNKEAQHHFNGVVLGFF